MERSTVGVIVGDPMKTSAPCPLAVRAAAETGDGGGVRERDVEILLCPSVNQQHVLALNPAARASCQISLRR